ncbi:putative F-box domain-containing protein [Medicago truncatula]|uniref:Putative F-box domain-containing protein n=2 Tax=Medicago truncatula TaxID=3880 RepID=A0A396HPH8_MEDTR|nr:putative F-box domain-containing protein [Medicago truncatula]
MGRSQSHISNDLFFSLLSKLPIKSLKRFGCVHKSWSLLFDNPHFMTMYRNNLLTKDHSYYHDTSFLLHQTFSPFEGYYHDETFDLYSLAGKRFENRIKLDWPSVKLDPIYRDQTEYDSGFNILGSGSVLGTLCLFCASHVNILLWNPSTMEFKHIPPSPLDSEPNCHVFHHAFGYDFVNNDYKVIRQGTVVDKTGYIWEIYSLRNNSWRKLDVDMQKSPMCENQLYIDGLSHWLCYGETHNETHLLSFDWSNEVFLTTPIPSDMDDNRFDCNSVWRHLVLLDGSIAFILNYIETGTFHISILGEFGVKKSWIKIFILGPLPYLEYPIGAGKKGDMLFRKKDDDNYGELVWFDLNTQMIEDLGITTERFSCKIVIHKESIIPLEGANI